MYRKWTALMIPAALMLAFGGNAFAGGGYGHDRGHDGYHNRHHNRGHVVDSYAHVRHGAPIVTYGFGNSYRPDHTRGYRHAPRHYRSGYRHGYRSGYRHGSRHGYRPGHHRSHRGYYERPYYRSHYRSRPGGHVTLHFGF